MTPYPAEQPQTSFSVDQDRRLLRVELSGTYSLPAFLDVIQSVAGLDEYEPGMDALYDARNAEFTFSADEVQALTSFVQDRLDTWGSGWRYAIAVSTELMYGLSRMISAWFDEAPFEARVFRSMDEAEEWVSAHRQGPT